MRVMVKGEDDQVTFLAPFWRPPRLRLRVCLFVSYVAAGCELRDSSPQQSPMHTPLLIIVTISGRRNGPHTHRSQRHVQR